MIRRRKIENYARIRVHVLKSKAFYTSLILSEDISRYSFDCEKKRHHSYQNNQCIMKPNFLTKLFVPVYWLETNYPNNPNSLSSAVYHTLLEYILPEHIKKKYSGPNIILVTDFFRSSQYIISIELIFLIVDHSLLPSDEVFDLIESIKKQYNNES